MDAYHTDQEQTVLINTDRIVAIQSQTLEGHPPYAGMDDGTIIRLTGGQAQSLIHQMIALDEEERLIPIDRVLQALDDYQARAKAA